MQSRLTLYIGILLISLATLALQVLQVRIFSFMLWHHLAYMVITVTLLGFGAAGAYVAVKGTGNEEEARKKAGVSGMLAAVTMILGFAVVTRVPLDTYMAASGIQFAFIFLYYAFIIVPYFFLGLSITIMLTRFSEFVHRLYFWNLLGSALGCAAVLWLLPSLGGEKAVFALAALSSVGAALIVPDRKSIAVAVGLAVFIMVLSPLATTIFPVSPAPTKALGMFKFASPDMKTDSIQWDPIARIDVVSSKKFSGLYRYHPWDVNKVFTIDGDAYTFAYEFHKPYPEVKLLGETLYASAYLLKDKPKAAVIGLGGGTDIMTALHFQAREITGVEINQAMIDAANNTYKTYKYPAYQDPSVTIVHEEGRSFLRRSKEKYDIIQMSGVDTWTALASGAYVLSENYLYTKEAFQEYYQHLQEDGILCMIRWIFNPPRECLRLVTSQTAVLKEMGATRPWNHFIVLKQGFLASVMSRPKAFSQREISRLQKRLYGNEQVEIVYAPGLEGNSTFHRYFDALKEKREARFLDDYPFKLEPVGDNRPFFFEFYKWEDMFRDTKMEEGGYLIGTKATAYIILSASLVQALIFGCLFILFPLWRFKRDQVKLESAGKMIVYFSALGLGFMFIEVALMQKFVLFLGHPTYSITITLFTLLIFSGVGSIIAGRLTIPPKKLILLATSAIAGLVLIYSFILTPLFNGLLGLSLPGRMASTVFILAPLALLMGMPFPTGLKYIGQGASKFIPWAFGVNGVASVVASVLCIIIALMAGFWVVLGLATLIYLIGGWTLYTTKIEPTSEG